jgi:large subunit ribosomal protein L30
MSGKRIQPDGAELRITQIRSVVGQKQNMRDTLRSLGLKRPGNVVVRKADAVTAGMVNTVAHLVKVEEAK